MNCKPGDIARIVYTPISPSAEGALVEVLGSVTCYARPSMASWNVKALSSIVLTEWTPSGKVIPGSTCRQPAGTIFASPDAYLRPIRPGEGDDETLQWAGLPRLETVQA